MTAELLQQIADTELPLIAWRLMDCPVESIPHLNQGDYHCVACGNECLVSNSHLELIPLGKNPILCLECAHQAARNQA